MPSIQSKLPNVGTTIFTSMSVLAAKHNAINLGQGFPDYAMDEQLVALANKAMVDGHNQYVHSNGLPLLREVLAQKINGLYQANVNADTEITITPGGTYALYTALTAILQKDDEVIVFEPAYDSYIPAIELNGAKAVTVALDSGTYKRKKEKTRAAITNKTKAILINSPHNPSGAVLEQDDIAFLEEITNGTDLFIISDEVYEHLIFDGKKHLSILENANLYQRSFVTFSLGKVYNCTGWKMGYAVAPPAFTAEFRKVHQFNCFTVFGPAQHALAAYLQLPEPYLKLGNQLQQKRDFFAELMQQTKFTPLASHGSYFQIYSYANISDMPEKQMAVHLVEKYGVATIPVSAFYKNEINNKVLRFCFAKQNQTLQAAAERLMQI
jgi:methionine transaminase